MNDLAYLAVITMHIEMLPYDQQCKVARLVDQLQAVLDANEDKEIAPIAVTVICARNLIEMTSAGVVE